MTWTVRRRWLRRRAVSEYRYDHHHEGEPLSISDLWIATPNALSKSWQRPRRVRSRKRFIR